MKTEYEYGPGFQATDDMRSAFEEFGYIIIRGILDSEEITKLRRSIEDNEELMKNSFELSDGEEGKSRACVWSHPGNDVAGLVVRSQKVAGTCEKLMGGEVYHYHSKLMMKEARTGGKFVWHQDYGYWYKNGCLTPDLMSVMIAIDKCEKANGCLQVLEKSHKRGRIEHLRVGGQTGADIERVEFIKKICSLKYVELQPGDALFFHSNLLHNSSANTSDDRRWVLIPAYNRRSNNPAFEHHHPQYTKLDIVPDDAVKSCTTYVDNIGKEYMDPDTDKTIVKLNPDQQP
ncbi:L-proline trans-4-hydroxylase-like isoform X1 [Haliotis rubra]|uniref:L-proline trans-4-hydroxylase-like isoform X1 n=2 Tax=Haliotis rubra TaxID=36100 RepID=UPI001EE55AF5|nr:L-proline trans-4-hydroxylase-like isoform X1 [Haliotis rubra]XP_046562118.1 L-proline trans-4-hydroxylase-like isoform X1 [Haliotis rubra]